MKPSKSVQFYKRINMFYHVSASCLCDAYVVVSFRGRIFCVKHVIKRALVIHGWAR